VAAASQPGAGEPHSSAGKETAGNGSDAAESECEKANIQRPTQNGLGAVEFGADLRGGASL